MVIFFNFSPTSNHLHPLQVENCDSNSRLVVDEDDNGKFRPERFNPSAIHVFLFIFIYSCELLRQLSPPQTERKWPVFFKRCGYAYIADHSVTL